MSTYLFPTATEGKRKSASAMMFQAWGKGGGEHKTFLNRLFGEHVQDDYMKYGERIHSIAAGHILPDTEVEKVFREKYNTLCYNLHCHKREAWLRHEFVLPDGRKVGSTNKLDAVSADYSTIIELKTSRLEDATAAFETGEQREERIQEKVKQSMIQLTVYAAILQYEYRITPEHIVLVTVDTFPGEDMKPTLWSGEIRATKVQLPENLAYEYEKLRNKLPDMIECAENHYKELQQQTL